MECQVLNSFMVNLNMNFKHTYVRFIRNQIRLMSVLKPKNHYDSLGISSTSTQGEVKSAYYKLSMLYHPDRNQGDEVSAQKFRDITEAYEVLGNVKTRKLYDKGFYFKTSATTDTTVDRFHKSRERRSRPPPPSGRSPVYDFDEWSKNHYGSTFKRRMDNRKREEMYKIKREQEKRDIKAEKMLFIFLTILLICTFMNNSSNKYDDVKSFSDRSNTASTSK